MSKSFISTDQELRKGDRLVSNNGQYEAVFQEDGNFVLYKLGGTPLWATNTVSPNPYRILLQTDTNLVMYDKQFKCVWCTGNFKQGGNRQRLRLTVTNAGRLEVDDDGIMIWNNQHGRVAA